MAEQVTTPQDEPDFTRESALLFVAEHFASLVVREQSIAGQSTLEFLEGMEPFGDSDLKEKIATTERELKLIRSDEYHAALKNLYFEVYNQLSDKNVIRLAEDTRYDKAVVQIGALNGVRVQAVIDDFLDGTYKAPTLQ